MPHENVQKKLLIFNIHGTLLDCSLVADKHPNSRVRPTFRTTSRRVFFTPWLQPFLTRCFSNFTVAFWGTKSTAYMDDIVPTILGMQQGGLQLKPLFVWSGKHCEAVKFEGGKPSLWGKPLKKVYSQWPRFNPSNTLIIDNNGSRVSCNLDANVFIADLFYVADLKKVGEDNVYLKSTLWPMLEALYVANSVTEFHLRRTTVVVHKAGGRHENSEKN